MHKENFPFHLASQSVTQSPSHSRPVYADKLKPNTLKAESSRRFADIESQKFYPDLFANPFSIDVDTAWSSWDSLSFNAAVLSGPSTVGWGFTSTPLINAKLGLHAIHIMPMFESTYSCKQMLSLIKLKTQILPYRPLE